MNSVHSRRHDHFVQQPFEANRQSHVAVMKKHFGLKRQLINGKGPTGNADHAHREKCEGARKRDLAKMKSECGCDVQIGIDVMNVVKSPEKREAMIGEMPVV